MPRDDSWLRRKRHGEKWVRFSAEIPPEIAAEIDANLLTAARPNTLSRADAVRSGLRLWLNHHSPEPEEAVESTGVEIVDLPALGSGGSDV